MPIQIQILHPQKGFSVIFQPICSSRHQKAHHARQILAVSSSEHKSEGYLQTGFQDSVLGSGKIVWTIWHQRIQIRKTATKACPT
jgi:hypothetical protein